MNPSMPGVLLAQSILALTWLAVGGCAKQAPVKPNPPTVYTVTVKPEPATVYVELIGTLDGALNADIRARVPGYIRAINYTEGSMVKAGDLLFTLDPVLADADMRRAGGKVDVAQAALEKAKTDVNRLAPLAKSKAVSQQELDHALAAQKESEAHLQAMVGEMGTARANLSYTRVTAPIDGLVGLARVQVGTLVGQGDPTLLTTISQLDPIKVMFTLSEQDYLRLVKKRGSDAAAANQERVPLELILADGSVHPHQGQVEVVDRGVDANTGTLTVKASFPNPDLRLRPGQYAKVRGPFEVLDKALLVPQRAVQELQGLKQVAVVADDNVVKIVPVEAGEKVDRRWIIRDGLKAGDRVIVEGLQKVLPGIKVNAKPAPAEQIQTNQSVAKAGAKGV